jgi:hypothetical protein
LSAVVHDGEWIEIRSETGFLICLGTFEESIAGGPTAVTGLFSIEVFSALFMKEAGKVTEFVKDCPVRDVNFPVNLCDPEFLE